MPDVSIETFTPAIEITGYSFARGLIYGFYRNSSRRIRRYCRGWAWTPEELHADPLFHTVDPTEHVRIEHMVGVRQRHKGDPKQAAHGGPEAWITAPAPPGMRLL